MAPTESTPSNPIMDHHGFIDELHNISNGDHLGLFYDLGSSFKSGILCVMKAATDIGWKEYYIQVMGNVFFYTI